jgi:hypothetical protein
MQKARATGINNNGNLKIVLLEESMLECSMCERTFVNETALHQHKSSTTLHARIQLQCPVSDTCSARFTSPSAMLSHIANRECSRTDDTVHARELAAKNVDLVQRNRELEDSLSELQAKYASLVTRAKNFKAKRDLEKLDLTERVSELERSLSESETKSADAAAKKDDLAQRNIELGVFVRALETKYEDSVTSAKADKAKRDVENTGLTQRVSELEKLLCGSETKNAKTAAKNDNLAKNNLELERLLSELKTEFDNFETRTKSIKAKREIEETKLGQRVSELESSLSASKEQGEEVAQRALELGKSLGESEARSANFAQQLNDNNSAASRKVIQLSSENFRLKDEAAHHESTAMILTSEVSALKIQVGTLRSDYHKALNQLASNAKPAENRLGVDSNQLHGFKGRPSMATETGVDTPGLTKSEVSWPNPAVAHVDTGSTLSHTDLEDESSRYTANQYGSDETRSSGELDVSACTEGYSQTLAYPGVDAHMISVLRAAGLYTPRTSDDLNFISRWTFHNLPFCRHSENSAAACPPTQNSSEDDSASLVSLRRTQNNGSPTSTNTSLTNTTDDELYTPSMSEGTASWANNLLTPQATSKAVQSPSVDNVVGHRLQRGLEIGLGPSLGDSVAENDPVAELATLYQNQLSLNTWGDVHFLEHH